MLATMINDSGFLEFAFWYMTLENGLYFMDIFDTVVESFSAKSC